MARYDLQSGWFKTPRGHSALMYIREETNDWNTCNGAMNHDEYGLHDLHLTGRALDIGGHLGAVSIAMLLDNPDLQVETVEPIPENVDLMLKNAVANGVNDRLTIWEAAIGDGTPVTIRYAYRDNENDLHHAYIGNSGLTADESREHSEVTVPTLTPADFDEYAFVKIDCEGGEWPFFAAAPVDTPLIFPLIVGEWHPVDGHTRDDLTALLPGYDITYTGPESGPGGFRAVRRPDAGGS